MSKLISKVYGKVAQKARSHSTICIYFSDIIDIL